MVVETSLRVSGVCSFHVGRFGGSLSIYAVNLSDNWEPRGRREQSVQHLCIPHQLTAPAVLIISSQVSGHFGKQQQ